MEYYYYYYTQDLTDVAQSRRLFLMHSLRLLSRGHDWNGSAILSILASRGHVTGECGGRMLTTGMDWLSRFTNFEQKGVPKNAGVDCDEGFSLVWFCSCVCFSEGGIFMADRAYFM